MPYSIRLPQNLDPHIRTEPLACVSPMPEKPVIPVSTGDAMTLPGGPPLSDSDMVIEPVLPCRPVYWESMNGTVHGPARVLFLTRTSRAGHYEVWLCLEVAGQTHWIR